MDIVDKRGTKGGQGNATSQYSSYLARACDWQYGADARADDIEAEKREEDLRFGVPHEPMDFESQNTPTDVMKAPSDPKFAAAVNADRVMQRYDYDKSHPAEHQDPAKEFSTPMGTQFSDTLRAMHGDTSRNGEGNRLSRTEKKNK